MLACPVCGTKKREPVRFFPYFCSCGAKVDANGTVLEMQRVTKRRRGLGDWLASITYWFGVRECAGCNRRKHWLNRMWFGFLDLLNRFTRG